MNKFLLLLLPLCLSAGAYAAEKEDQLLSAQIQYQNALKAQGSSKEKVLNARTRVENAKNRVSDARRELQNAETEYSAAVAEEAQNQRTFEEAGRNLDRAWGIQ